MIVEFYQNLFKEEEVERKSSNIFISYSVLSINHNNILSRAIIIEEIRKDIFVMGGTKVLGEDCMLAILFFFKLGCNGGRCL